VVTAPIPPVDVLVTASEYIFYFWFKCLSFNLNNNNKNNYFSKRRTIRTIDGLGKNK